MAFPGIGVGPDGQFGVSASGGPISSQDTKPISFSTGAFGAPSTTGNQAISMAAILIFALVTLWLVSRLSR